MMQKTKRQHYVPKSYLRRFCKDGQQLFAFDKTKRESIQTGVANIALEGYFYDMPEELVERACLTHDIDVQFVEKSFSKMEGWSKALFDELLTEVDRRGVVPMPLRFKLAPFIVVQLLRTRLHRDLLLETTLKTHEAMANKVLEISCPEAAKEVEIKVGFDRSLLPVLHARSMFNEDIGGPHCLDQKPQFLNY